MHPRALNIMVILCLTFLGSGCAHKLQHTPDNAVPDRGFSLYEPYRVFLAGEDKDLVQAFAFRADTDEKIVALTFDDGPTAHARQITATLEGHACPATFFLIAGRLDEANLAAYDHELFEVGIHGYEHRKFTIYDRETSHDQIHRARQAMQGLGLFPRYFRPPYGVINGDLKDALQTEGLSGILWSLDSLDWNSLAGEDLVKQVTSGLCPGTIVLLHECPATAKALPGIIEGIRAQGFHIVPLESLLYHPRHPFPEYYPPLIVQSASR